MDSVLYLSTNVVNPECVAEVAIRHELDVHERETMPPYGARFVLNSPSGRVWELTEVPMKAMTDYALSPEEIVKLEGLGVRSAFDIAFRRSELERVLQFAGDLLRRYGGWIAVSDDGPPLFTAAQLANVEAWFQEADESSRAYYRQGEQQNSGA